MDRGQRSNKEEIFKMCSPSSLACFLSGLIEGLADAICEKQYLGLLATKVIRRSDSFNGSIVTHYAID